MPTTSGDSLFGSFRLSPRERRLLQNGQEVPLTPKAFDTLQVLVSRAGELVEKQDLMKAVWGEVFVDDSTLTQNIFTLRNALGDREFIETVPRRGYRFTAEVTPLDSPAESAPPPRRSFPWIAAALAGTVATLAVAAWVYLRQPYNPLEGAPPPMAITNSPGDDADAVISQDGKWVAYIAENGGSYDIMMHEVGTDNPYPWSADGWAGAGRNQIRDLGFTARGWLWNRPNTGKLTSGRLQSRQLRDREATEFLEPDASLPMYSRDGKRMVYIRTGEPIDGEPPTDYLDALYLTDSEGATEHKLILPGPKNGPHTHPMAWSDDDWIYLTRGELGTPPRYELWRIRPSGKDLQQITHLNSDVAYPTLLDNRTILYLARDQKGAGPWLYALDVERGWSIRIPFGPNQLISLAGSADGSRVVATLASPKVRLWSVPILPSRMAVDDDKKEVSLPGVQRASSPCYVGESGELFFLGSNSGGDGLWRHRDGKPESVWNGSEGALFEPPAVSRDGKQIAIKLPINGNPVWHVRSADGSGYRPVGAHLDIEGGATWNPEGTALLAGVSKKNEGTAGLFLIPADGSAPTRFFTGTAKNPVWSPLGDLIVYSGQGKKGAVPLLALGPTGQKVDFPAGHEVEGISQQSGRFLPDGKSLIYRRGSSFWRLDLLTKKSFQLTQFSRPATVMGNFDITPDGKTILFDVSRRDSDVYLIEVPDKSWYRKIF